MLALADGSCSWRRPKVRLLPGVDNIGQVAFVVRDLDRAMATWVGMGIAPWRIYTCGPDRLTSMTFRGREQPQVIRFALCSLGPLTCELIESLQRPTIYEEHLDRCG